MKEDDVIKVAIQAGGKGSRIAKYFPDLPKPMILLLGKPILQYQIESLVKQGFTNITLIVGYKGDVIKEYFANGERFGAHIDYITEESPLGTGGALALLPKVDTLILFGDVFCDVDFNSFIEFHKYRNADITLFAHPNSHPYDSDIVVTNNTDRVTNWASKKDTKRGAFRNLVNAGMYIFNGNVLPTGTAVKCDLEQDIIIPNFKKFKVYAYRSAEYVKDMGVPDRLFQVESDIMNGITMAKNLRNKQKAIFIDRDGTINVDNGYVTKPEQLYLIDGAAEAIKRINQSKYIAICVTNQPVVARGDVTFEELEKIHSRLDALLGEQCAYLDDLLFCPHHTDKGFDGEVKKLKFNCNCRKPKPGLLFQAAKRYNIDLSQSYMIGDSDSDIKAGEAAMCKAIRVSDKYTLCQAVHFILEENKNV